MLVTLYVVKHKDSAIAWRQLSNRVIQCDAVYDTHAIWVVRPQHSLIGNAMRMRQTSDQFELAFEQEAALERQRRTQLRQRAANRSRARRMQQIQQHGNVAFGVLVIALTVTVLTVTVVMFETLAWLMS